MGKYVFVKWWINSLGQVHVSDNLYMTEYSILQVPSDVETLVILSKYKF